MSRERNTTIAVPATFLRRVRQLALEHERSVAEIVQNAVELHYGDAASSARSRLLDRLARLEAGLGDAAVLEEQIATESRRLRQPAD